MRHRQRSGYTIVELMIAIVIFAIGIMAIYSLQVITITGLAEARELSEATNLAERVLEQFRRSSTTWEGGSTLPGLPHDFSPDRWLVLYPEPVDKDGLLQGQLPPGAAVNPPRYCVKYRICSRLGCDNLAASTAELGTDAYEVEVRVMWPRQNANARDFARCPIDMDAPQNIPFARQVALATAIFRH